MASATRAQVLTDPSGCCKNSNLDTSKCLPQIYSPSSIASTGGYVSSQVLGLAVAVAAIPAVTEGTRST